MSTLSKWLHGPKDASATLAAIRKAIQDIRGYIGSVPVDTAVNLADDQIEKFEALVIQAGQAYLRAKLGDNEFEKLAEGVATTAAHAMASALEGAIAGVAHKL